MPKSKQWPQVEQLINEQKFEEARTLVGKIREDAIKSGNGAEWTEALIKEVQLQTGLHGYETSVRFLREQKWPADALSQLTLELYYARSLMNYLDMYSWEIGQREKVDSKNVVDLKAWTRDEIFTEAQKAYGRVYAQRAQLSQVKAPELADYINPNTYPERIRGTLRDAVSYLAVELLLNTTYWRPQESNGVYQLDLKALIKQDTARAGRIKIDDQAVHPIERAMAVLDDLEGWHAQEGHKEAALQARIERLQRLGNSFTEAEDRQLLRGQLEQILPQYRSFEWWAQGQYVLAGMVRDYDHDLVRAHTLAVEGEKAFPNSVGSLSCAYLARAIEAPDFQLAAMRVDAANQRSIQLTHKNMQTLYMRAYRMDLLKRLETSQDYNLLPAGHEMRELLGKSKPVAEWTQPLPATPDYKLHQTFVTPPLKERGFYAIVASARPEFNEGSNRVTAVNFIVSDLVMVTRQESGDERVSVVSGSTGQIAVGARVHLYQLNYGHKHARIRTETVTANAEIRFSASQSRGNSTFLVAEKDGDLTLDPQTSYLYQDSRQDTVRASMVFTDRSIYRPQQKLQWKVVAYTGKRTDARFKVEPGAELTVGLYDPNNQQVEKRTVKTNSFGSAAGEFVIPTGRLLGGWYVRVNNYDGAAGVRVEEYKRPTFEVSLKDPAAALRLNRPAALVGEARYYFGLPVAAGLVKWRVTREPVWPWWWGLWGWGGGASTPQTIAAGSAKLEADGTFKLEFTPEADEKRGKDVSYRYQVKADLTDEGGETRSAERSFRLGFVSIEATMRADTGFLRKGHVAETPITVVRASLDGVPRKGEGSYRVLAIQQPQKAQLPADLPILSPPNQPKGFQTPGDTLRPRWGTGYTPESHLAQLPDGKEISHGTLRHDDKGEAKITLTELAPGPYRVRYETKDEFGNKAEAWKDVVVAAAETPLALPLMLVAERTSVRVGETARLFASTGLVDQPMYLDRYRAGILVERRVLGTGRTLAPEVLEMPITEADRGGFALTLWCVRDHQYLAQNTSVHVPWDNKELQIAFSTFRDKLRPGSSETWRVTVSDRAGKTLGANMVELLAYMYDRSLDLFGPHSPPSPLSLYPSRAHGGWSRTNLGPASLQYIYNGSLSHVPSPPSLSPDSLKFYESYGLGGPGARGGYGGGGIRMMAMPMQMAPGAPPPAPPPPPPQGAPVGRAATEAAPEMPADQDEKAPSRPEPLGGLAKNKSSGGEAGPEVQIRSNFAESAFWRPNLLAEKDGSATIEFTVPDSVTSWNVWVHAMTRDLSGGSLKKETRSVKDLMVRPYLPRFFREGDRAELKVTVNNAGDHALSGQLTLEVSDPDTQESRIKQFGIGATQQPFAVEPGKGATLTFPLVAPAQVGTYAFKVTAVAGNLGDGELRPLPVLPSRMHLAQSKFVTLRDKDQRTITFDDLRKTDDPSRISEQLVVTLDAQLFYTVLKALPYLVSYPYECVEQTLNRFVSTGIATSMFGSYPAVAKMAAEMSKRTTQYEKFDDSDPNRKMTLEESPWLENAQGGRTPSDRLLNVLDPNVARAQRDAALARLRKVQTSLGGFPWFPGGPPSPFMTLYLMSGFARAAEFQVEVPKDTVQRGWQYLAKHFREEYAVRMMKEDCCWEFLTLLNYVAGSYPDATWTGDALTSEERKKILEFSFKHWKKHSPYLKGLLSLTLHRMGRTKDAKLVWASVMDSAKTERDQGTFWAPEDRSWLWYNDTIESHAFALRVLMELDPQNAKKDGLVLWLLLNKKMNQWKSTRATAEVLYSLAHYLKKEGALGIREEATVRIGQQQQQFVFEPDQYVGKTQVVLPGASVDRDPVGASTISVQKPTKGIMFASATWHFSTEKLPTEGRGDFFQISRSYFRRENNGKEFVLTPLREGAKLTPGDEVEVQISIRSKHAAEYVHLRDPRAAGLEPENAVSRYKWDLGIGFYEEVRDSGMNFFFEQLPAGEYTFKYRVRANLSGTFRVGPATIQSMYAPEFVGYSAGHVLSIGSAK